MSNEYSRHYENNVIVKAKPEDIFTYADNYKNFSSHMNNSSWMIGGGSMKTEADEGNGQKVGSHIQMNGTVFGANLFLDEVIVEYNPPHRKAWKTVGAVNLLVIDQYKLGFEINPTDDTSSVRVYIDYNLPQSWKTRLLGRILSGIYAKWCVEQMTNGTKEHFESLGSSK